MDLSVIIPCHNLSTYINPMLQSLERQNLDGHTIELIFIFDACTDDTRAIVEKYIPHFHSYEAIHLVNANVKSCGFARNVGLDFASGHYIWFMDGDDWLISDDALSICVENMNFHKVPLIRFGFDHPNTFKFGNSPVMVWQYCYSREIIGNTRFLNIQPHEDKAFNKEIFAKLGEQNPKRLRMNLYYYNYGREGSNMQQLITTGEIKP